MKVEIEASELLMDLEDSELCLRFFLRHARRRGSRIFEIFSTKEKIDHQVASRNRWLEFQPAERWQGSSVPRKKDDDAATAVEFFVSKQSSSSAREEESQWISVEDKRKWCVAFEDAAKINADISTRQ